MKQLALLLLSGVLLLGCGGKENMEEILKAGEVTAAPTAVTVPTPEPTPAPTPTPEPTPTPLFVPREEGSTDLNINRDLYRSFTETEFPLPSAPVVLIYHTRAE